jgi:hypothetical protein
MFAPAFFLGVQAQEKGVFYKGASVGLVWLSRR